MSHVDGPVHKPTSQSWKQGCSVFTDDSYREADVWFTLRPSGSSLVRRRGSSTESTHSVGEPGLRSRKSTSHRRGTTSEGSLAHPLQSSTSASTLDAGVTRPKLRRWLSASAEDMKADESLKETVSEIGSSSRVQREMECIVHQVNPTDSLAGVALKYGISVAALRKANHLWASDTIHLRKVLHIPLNWTNKKRRVASREAINPHPPIAVNTSLSSSATHSQSPSTAGRGETPDRIGENISSVQRIPISQLTFFPPPSQSSLTSSSTQTLPRKFTITTPHHTRSTSSSRSLAVLFNAIPLPSADAFSARISLDSSSNDTYSGSNRSDSSADQDQEHEMSVMGVASATDTETTTRRRSPPRHTGKLTQSSRLNGRPGSHEDWENSVSLEDRRRTVPAVRTEQLKPSPRMELPKSLCQTGG